MVNWALFLEVTDKSGNFLGHTSIPGIQTEVLPRLGETVSIPVRLTNHRALLDLDNPVTVTAIDHRIGEDQGSVQVNVYASVATRALHESDDLLSLSNWLPAVS